MSLGGADALVREHVPLQKGISSQRQFRSAELKHCENKKDY
jgi:hypothetical protein